MTTQQQEAQTWKNDSSNPLCQMYCVAEEYMILLDVHKVNMEQAFYDYLQKFLGYPLWSVKCGVVPVAAMKPGQFRIYNDYVKACKEQQKKTEQELYAVELTFDVDSSG